MTWTTEHGPDELYSKFTVIRNRTGEPLPEDEFVFVLRPESDEAACYALLSYSFHVRGRSPDLADQVQARIFKIMETNITGGAA